jgi:hypothetical protein
LREVYFNNSLKVPFRRNLLKRKASKRIILRRKGRSASVGKNAYAASDRGPFRSFISAIDDCRCGWWGFVKMTFLTLHCLYSVKYLGVIVLLLSFLMRGSLCGYSELITWGYALDVQWFYIGD